LGPEGRVRARDVASKARHTKTYALDPSRGLIALARSRK
jgi:hypothetical protein